MVVEEKKAPVKAIAKTEVAAKTQKKNCVDPKIAQATLDYRILRILIIN